MAGSSAVMLLAADRAQSRWALPMAEEFLAVRQVQWSMRDDRRLHEPCVPADYLLNFLSAPRVMADDLRKYTYAINFHPAPPEYPGVGSASLAIYDKRTMHGVTAHLMSPRYDAGTILRVRRFAIEPEWGYEQLFARALDEALLLFREMVRAIADEEPLRTTSVHWARRAWTRKEFEQHPSFVSVRATTHLNAIIEQTRRTST